MSTKAPVTRPPSVVLTPLALLTAVRVKEPVTGIDDTKLPIMLHMPKATISWEAFTILPLAGSDERITRLHLF